MIEVFSFNFTKKLSSTAYVFEVRTAFWPYLDDDDELWKNKLNSSNNLINILKRLCQKY